ncbi:unnamed protein product [Parajaminaea phylloscopi]
MKTIAITTAFAPLLAAIFLALLVSAVPVRQSSFAASRKSCGSSPSSPSSAKQMTLLTGAYSGDFSVLSFDTTKNQLTNVTSTRKAGVGPSWATWDGVGNDIYVTDDSASVTSKGLHHFTLDTKRGLLTRVDAGRSGLQGTVHVTRSRAKGSSCFYSAGYGAKAISSQALVSPKGTYALLGPSLRTFSGSGPDKARQDQSRPHQAIDSPDGKYVYVPDLGTDAVHVFQVSDVAKCTLKRLADVKVASGDGPRHMAFYADAATGKTFAYLVTELSGTVRSYKVDTSTGNLTLIGKPLQTYLDPSESRRRRRDTSSANDGVQPSEPIVSPDGRFVYVANRHLPRNGSERGGQDTLALFKRDTKTGQLSGPVASYQSGGRNPRHASISPDKRGSYIAVANQADDGSPAVGNSVAVLKRNATDGSLTTAVVWSNVTGAAFAGWWSGGK